MDPRNPLTYIGVPDWRSLVLALAFTAPWLVLLARRWLRRYWIWAAAAIGVVAFPVSIAWIQVPIQQAINTLLLRTFPEEVLNQYVLLLSIPIIVASGLVQETVKLGIAVAGLHLARVNGSARGGLAFGAAAGAGYGAIEAFWVFNQIFAVGFTLATIQLGGVQALLGFVERFFSVMFHISVAALSAYGYATGRPGRYLLLAIGLHSLVNYLTIPLQEGLLSVVGTEAGIALVALVAFGAALWVRSRPPARAPMREDGGDAGEPA